MERGNENEKVVSAVSAEPPVIHAVDVFPVGVEAADPNIEGDAISDDFIYLLCCAFSWKNMDWPTCWGTRSECTLLCIENSTAKCKFVDDAKNYFICKSGGVEIVRPRMCYSEYAQCCCLECYAALPPIEGKFKKIHNRHHQVTANFKPAGDATFCNGGCCFFSSCNCNCKTCWGCYGKSVHCCFESEGIMNKPLCCETEKPNPDTWCILNKGHTSIVRPYTCVKSLCACFCCDYRCALPCDEEVPCIYSLCCCCTLCVDWQFLLTCCNTVNQIADKSRAKRGLPPMQYNTTTATTTTSTATASNNTQYQQVSAPATATATAYAQPHGEQHYEYKAAPTSAPLEVAVAEQLETNKI